MIDLVDVLRGFTVLLTLTVIALFCWRYGRGFKLMEVGPRLYFGSVILVLVTVTWDTWIFVVADLGFSWRIVPLSMGLAFSLIYLLEPWSVARKRLNADPLSPEHSSVEMVELRTENSELRDRLYEALRQENAAKLKLMAVETINEGLKESRRATRAEQRSTDQERAQARRSAAEGIARQDAEDGDGSPFVQADRDQDRADARGRASDEIKKQDGEDSR